MVLIFIFFRGQLTLILLKDAVWTSIKTVGSLYLIVIGASIFNYLITVTQLPFAVVDFINELQLTPLGVILVICAIYIVLGTVMDSLAMLFLTIPVFYPVIVDAGIDPVWFGIFAVIVVEFGLISPPVGMNLFVIKGIAKAPMEDVIYGILPYVLLMFLGLVIVLIFPQLALWLPTTMGYGL